MMVVPVSFGTNFGIFAGVFGVLGILLVLMMLPQWIGRAAERALTPSRRRNRYVSPFDPANRNLTESRRSSRPAQADVGLKRTLPSSLSRSAAG